MGRAAWRIPVALLVGSVVLMLAVIGCVKESPNEIPRSVPVPQVVGMEPDAAQKKLETAGFRVDVIERHGPPDVETEYGPGVIYQQSPVRGAIVSRGSTVTVEWWWEEQ